MTTTWVICGTGSGVGKTHLAQKLCDLLPSAVYAKCGCGQPKPGKPPNFFQNEPELASFAEQCRGSHEHIVVEYNGWAREGRGDVIVFLDGIPHETDPRDDVEVLRSQAHLRIGPGSSEQDWKKALGNVLADGSLRDAVCDAFADQQRFLTGPEPAVRTKTWFVVGEEHAFGAGLARLLESVDRFGTLCKAAEAARMSYRHAWNMIRTAEKHLGKSLLVAQSGGAGGGRSSLSQEARRLLDAFKQVDTEVAEFADRCSAAPLDDSTPEPNDAIRPVDALRISTSGDLPMQDHCNVVVEELVTVMVEDVGSFSLMCTPSDAVALAVGFVFSEGMISSPDDIIQLSQRQDPRVVAMKLEDPQQVAAGRNLIVTSSCGLCGSRNVEKLLAGLNASQDALRVSGSLLRKVADDMREVQGLFKQTGGTHAAAVFSAEGEIIALGEDIGRHSALDKAVGKCLLNGESLDRRGVMLSGRVSLEMVAKAARAGIEIMAAVSAPSSLAIEVAQRCNITLCGFVRGQRATVYTHPHRIEGVKQDTPNPGE